MSFGHGGPDDTRATMSPPIIGSPTSGGGGPPEEVATRGYALSQHEKSPTELGWVQKGRLGRRVFDHALGFRYDGRLTAELEESL